MGMLKTRSMASTQIGGLEHRCDSHGGWHLLDDIWEGQMSVTCGEGRTFFPIIDLFEIHDSEGPR